MHFILLQNYNNYYNRTYKSEDSLAQYRSAVTDYTEELSKSVNFNIEDGINMKHVFNGSFVSKPNYLVLLKESDDSIHSRWFVIEWRKIRGSQFHATLRRDLLADNFDAILSAPAFIEKGFVNDFDPAIFNNEDMSFNQIKQSETLLKDDSNTAWIVGYVANDLSSDVTGSFTTSTVANVKISGNFSDWAYANICDGAFHTTLAKDNSNNKMRFCLGNPIYEFMFNGATNSINPRSELIWADYWQTQNSVISEYINSDWSSDINWTNCLDKVAQDNLWTSVSDFETVKNMQGLIQFDDGVYRISIMSEVDAIQNNWQYYNNGNLYDYLYNIVAAQITNLGGSITDVHGYPVAYKLMIKTFRIVAEKLTIAGTYGYTIKTTTRSLDDAPYRMFAIPYCNTNNDLYTVSLDGSTFTTIDKEVMFSWAMSLTKSLSSNLYDIQILPYCPISLWRGRLTQPGIWVIDKQKDVDYTELLDYQDNVVGFCIWCDVSTKEQWLDEYQISIDDYKVSNECDSYRICSPNYASVFEFNPTKNDGVTGFFVRYTYKPYQPFINVLPKFNRLYGEDFNDNRGLICSGDFSLPVVTDAWTQYQLNNKNYQLSFDRQIQNMEVQNKWQRRESIVNAVVGTAQGGATGAAMGAMVGGVPGAIVGGAVGTVGSITGGLADIQMQQALQNEAIDFAKDNFGYQLQNIKALPNTLNKVSSIVANSKIFPFLEKYSCTDEEKEALKDKIKYNGMTIGRIGQILSFLNPDDTTYVKGQIIRLEGNFDAHTLNEIANEFMKGWYI